MTKRILILLASLLLIGLLLFFFFPRPLLSAAFASPQDIEELTLLRIGENGETDEVILSGERLSAFLKSAEGVRLFRSPIRKHHTGNGPDFVGCFLFARYNREQSGIKNVYLFTRELLTVDGVQYRFYGGGFTETVLDLLNETD